MCFGKDNGSLGCCGRVTLLPCRWMSERALAGEFLGGSDEKEAT